MPFELYSLRNIYLKRSSKQFQTVYQFKLFLSHVLWYFINAAIFLLAAYFSPQDIMKTHPRRAMYAFGFQFILLSLRIQLSGVTQERFNPFRRTNLICWALLLSQTIFAIKFGKSLMDEPSMYLFIDVFSFLSLAHFILNVIDELKTILGINLLTLNNK